MSGFEILSILSIGFLSFLLFLALFEPALRYRVSDPITAPLDSERFLNVLAALADSGIHRGTQIRVLTNGEVYYPEVLEQIRRARQSINIEAYIFQKGEIGQMFVDALDGTRAGRGEGQRDFGRDRQLRNVVALLSHAHRRGRPCLLLSRISLAPVAAPEQPDSPRDHCHRLQVGFVGGPGHRRPLVEGEEPEAAALARHSVSRRRRRGLRTSGDLYRELSGGVGRASLRRRLLLLRHKAIRRRRPRNRLERIVGPVHARADAVSDSASVPRRRRSRSPLRTSCPTRDCARS